MLMQSKKSPSSPRDLLHKHTKTKGNQTDTAITIKSPEDDCCYNEEDLSCEDIVSPNVNNKLEKGHD